MLLHSTFTSHQVTPLSPRHWASLSSGGAGQTFRAMDPIAGQVLGALAVVFATTAVLYVAVVFQRRKALLPGPWPWPVFGSLPLLLMNPLPHKSLQQLATKYGGLMYLQLGQKPCLVVSTAAAAKEVFQKHDATFSSRPKRLVIGIISAGTYRTLPFAPYGPFWRQMRRVANTQLFSPAVHSSHETIRKDEVHHMMRVLLDDSQNGKTVNLKGWLTSVTANNMTMMLTNTRYFGSTGVENEQRKKDFEELMRRAFAGLGAFIISDFVPYLSFIPKLQGWVSETQAVRALLVKVMSGIMRLDKHMERALETSKDSEYVPDFIDVLLKARLADKDIMSLVNALMNAGTDTSALTVEWGMAELMANPNLRKQAQAEIDAVVGQDRLVQESDLANLPFLQAVVKETYRMHPSLPLGLPRESHEPCVVSGCELPAHTELILNIFAIHRDAAVYESPDEFKPSRFLDRPEVDPLSGHDHYELMPFGAGRRMCAGYNLGNVMATSMLATLLQCFDWSLPGGESAESLDMSEYFSFTSCRRHPLCLVAQPRRAASLLQLPL